MQSSFSKSVSPYLMEEASENDSFLWRLHDQADLDSWMHGYLREEGRQQHFCDAENEVSLVLSAFLASEPSLAPVDPPVQAPAPTIRKNKSIFHNFQKNLLSLLKRTVHIKKQDLIASPYGVGAFDLWKLFLQQELLSKKALYVTFGVKPKQNANFLRKMALESPNIVKLLQKYGQCSIEQSQKLLRGEVHQKASLLERIEIEAICKVKDFASFYRYFLIFVGELSEGALSQRMTKAQKYQHLSSAQ